MCPKNSNIKLIRPVSNVKDCHHVGEALLLPFSKITWFADGCNIDECESNDFGLKLPDRIKGFTSIAVNFRKGFNKKKKLVFLFKFNNIFYLNLIIFVKTKIWINWIHFNIILFKLKYGLVGDILIHKFTLLSFFLFIELFLVVMILA